MAKREQTIGKSTGKNKTKMKVYNSREAIKIVKKNGYTYQYTKGSHNYFRKGKQQIIIAKNLNRMIWERLVKEYSLDLCV